MNKGKAKRGWKYIRRGTVVDVSLVSLEGCNVIPHQECVLVLFEDTYPSSLLTEGWKPQGQVFTSARPEDVPSRVTQARDHAARPGVFS